jgi:uncharacterized protein YbaR (Trm112 family)
MSGSRPPDPGATDLWAALACPATGEPLQPLPGEAVERLNGLIASGHALHGNGASVQAAVEAALWAPLAQRVYPVRGGLAFLLPEDAIRWTG